MLLGAKRVKEKMINDLVEMLYNYKKHCGQSTNPSQLLLPETLKNFPLLILSALKSPAFRLLNVCKLDYKIAQLYRIVTLSFSELSCMLYPRIYPVTDLV